MEWLKQLLRNKPHIAISIPTILCFITFCTNLCAALSDGRIDSNEFNGLLSTADGFEAVILFIVMLALKAKKK